MRYRGEGLGGCVCERERVGLTFCSSIQAEKFDRLSRHVFMLGTALNVYSDKENVEMDRRR